MENNNAPFPPPWCWGLAQDFGVDVTDCGRAMPNGWSRTWARGAGRSGLCRCRAAPRRPAACRVERADVWRAPFSTLHRAYRQTHERLASLDEALGQERLAAPSPWEEVRRFLPLLRQLHRRGWTAPPNASPRWPRAIWQRIRRPCWGAMGVSLRFRGGAGRARLRSRDPHPDDLPPRRGRDAAIPAAPPICAAGSGAS